MSLVSGESKVRHGDKPILEKNRFCDLKSVNFHVIHIMSMFATMGRRIPRETHVTKRAHQTAAQDLAPRTRQSTEIQS